MSIVITRSVVALAGSACGRSCESIGTSERRSTGTIGETTNIDDSNNTQAANRPRRVLLFRLAKSRLGIRPSALNTPKDTLNLDRYP